MNIASAIASVGQLTVASLKLAIITSVRWSPLGSDVLPPTVCVRIVVALAVVVALSSQQPATYSSGPKLPDPYLRPETRTRSPLRKLLGASCSNRS